MHGGPGLQPGLSHEDEEWAGVSWGKGCTDGPRHPLGGDQSVTLPPFTRHQTQPPPFQDINFSEKKMLFVFFPGKILIMGLMCLSCFCVSRGFFQPGCCASHAPAPQPPAHQPPSPQRQTLPRVGGWAPPSGWAQPPPSASPPPPPAQSQTLAALGGSMRPAGGAGVASGSRLRYISGCLKRAFLSLPATERQGGREARPSVRPSSHCASPGDDARYHRPGRVPFIGATATTWADPSLCPLGAHGLVGAKGAEQNTAGTKAQQHKSRRDHCRRNTEG